MKMERDMNNILMLSTDIYKNQKFIRIQYTLNHAQIQQTDQFWLERIDTPLGSPTAVKLLTSKQPVYFWQNFEEGENTYQNIQDAVFISEHTYLQSYDYEDPNNIEKKYNQEWINVSSQIKGASKALYDLDISNLGDRVYGYRLHYFTYDEEQIHVTSHLATQFSAIAKFKYATDNLSLSYGGYRPCITNRNFAYRGKNSIEKYNYTLTEAESDVYIINKKLNDITPGEITKDNGEIINMMNNITIELNKLYALKDYLDAYQNEGVPDDNQQA